LENRVERSEYRHRGLPAGPLPELAVSLIFIAADHAVSHVYDLRQQLDGYSVAEATTVEEAAALSVERLPDLLILDLGPSSLEGLTILRELKADGLLGSVPLLLLAAFDDLEDIREGLKLGARDYIIRGETSPSVLARGVPGWVIRRSMAEVL
jgi:two-component system, OmpR family, phosphate regulon response regulator PhoB